MTSASLASEKPRIWRWEGRALAILFGIGVVLWPFLAFGAIFMFDSPIQNRSDEVNRYTIAYFIWFYPVTYGVTFLLYYVLRRCGVWRSVSCIVWALPVAAYFIIPAIAGWNDVEQANSKRVQILYRTDYAALLAACREVMTNGNSFRHWERYGNEVIDPKDPKLPAAIATLQPTFIGFWSYNGSDVASVSLGLHDGIDDLNVVACPEQYANSQTNGLTGNLRLISDLWFDDSEFTYQDTVRTNYIKKLEAMKPSDAPIPIWWHGHSPNTSLEPTATAPSDSTDR